MKIAITGHTSGIGKSLFDYYDYYTALGVLVRKGSDKKRS